MAIYQFLELPDLTVFRKLIQELILTMSFIQNNFILVSLYVDDKALLPVDKRFIYTTTAGAKKEIISVGDLWATFQAENFNQSTQPLYVVMSPDQKLLSNPVGYTPNAKEYLNWLQCSASKNK